MEMIFAEGKFSVDFGPTDRKRKLAQQVHTPDLTRRCASAKAGDAGVSAVFKCLEVNSKFIVLLKVFFPVVFLPKFEGGAY